MRRIVLGSLVALVAALLAPAAQARTPQVDHHRATPPALHVKRLVTGLDHPWDVRPIGHGRLIYTQRDRATVSIWTGTRKRVLKGFPSDSVWVSGETGLMGLETDPRFATNHVFYTCQGGFTSGGGHDVRVMRWTLNDRLTRVSGRKHLLGGFPTTSGRHGGCRLLAVGKRMYVGTGDAATGTNPENRKSLGGKTLCLLLDGRPCPSNPFARSRNHDKRYVQTWGHRNVQGLDRRRDGTLWSVEQGTYRDDEVNRLRTGGDYGYNPVPGYDESVPMTDHSLPGRQIGAAWSSGDPTLATSGGGWIYGKGLGAYDGTFAVAALKAQRVLFLTISAKGRLQSVRVPPALTRYGRIRTVVDGPGDVFYVTTDNGGGDDAILAVRPRA